MFVHILILGLALAALTVTSYGVKSNIYVSADQLPTQSFVHYETQFGARYIGVTLFNTLARGTFVAELKVTLFILLGNDEYAVERGRIL